MNNELGVILKGLRMSLDKKTDMKTLYEQFETNPLAWRSAFEFVNRTDLSEIDLGRYELRGGSLAIVKEYDTHANGLFEAHRKHVDFQYLALGYERMDVAPLSTMKTLAKPYNEEEDCILYQKDINMRAVILTPEILAILFPEDAHAPEQPARGIQKVKKVIVKVPFNEK